MDRHSIHTGIWLIGLGILFLTGRFWPGILILIGFSMLVEAMYSNRASSAPAENQKTGTPPPPLDGPIPPALGSAYTPLEKAHDASRLPEVCPLCGGPVSRYETELEWTGYDSARCPYCGTNLPLEMTDMPGIN
jgi:hypothetical protein